MSKTILLTNCIAYTGSRILNQHAILVESGKIKALVPDSELKNYPSIDQINLNGNYLIPGFIDLQLNAGGGVFFTQSITEEAIEKIYRVYLEFGTTSFLPTLISTTFDNMIRAIEVTGNYMRKHGNIVPGLHMEGPFFNIKKKGAHLEKFIKKPSDQEINTIAEKGKGIVKLITLAPEMVSDKQIRTLVEAGINVSAGHTDCSYAEAMHGFNAGINGVTHVFNAMSQFSSRSPGMVGAFLDHDKVWGGIIVDGAHSEFASVRIAHKLRKGRLFIVSDASFVKHPHHLKETDFGYGILHYENGQYYTPGGNLAGVSISMLESMQNCVRHVGIDLEEAVKMSSTYPAQYIGADHYLGKIEEGYIANLLVLDKDLKIEKVFAGGELAVPV
jgi:N-acetylglucosamine-6-phosphate deacetylase